MSESQAKPTALPTLARDTSPWFRRHDRILYGSAGGYFVLVFAALFASRAISLAPRGSIDSMADTGRACSTVFPLLALTALALHQMFGARRFSLTATLVAAAAIILSAGIAFLFVTAASLIT